MQHDVRQGLDQLDADVRRRDALSEDRLAQHLGRVLTGEARRRHAGEGRELVHHPADVADLTDDGLGATIEDLDVIADLRAVFATQAFRRQLDRRQGVLDLVGNATGHVTPGGVTLGGHKAGDVVEGQHHLAALPSLDADPQAARLAVAADVDVFLDVGLGALRQLRQFRRDLAQ
ncbi:hypothetical protein D3C80_1020650 [compost metagenome]